MLALSRKKNESIIIDNNIEVTVLDIKGDQIKLGILSRCRCTARKYMCRLRMPIKRQAVLTEQRYLRIFLDNVDSKIKTY